MKMKLKLTLAWISAFVLCAICSCFWPVWIAGVVVGVVYLITKYDKRYIVQNAAMNIVYILLWPMCLPFLGIAFLRLQRVRPIRATEPEPWKLEL